MDDLISRQAALKLLRGECVAKYPSTFSFGLFAAADEIGKLSSIEAAPVRHGRWYLTEEGDLECSNCKNLTAICECGEDRTYRKPFCPNCGAKMEVDHETD